jgi:hypothetical protein
MPLARPAPAIACGANAGNAPNKVNCAMSYTRGQILSSVEAVPVFWSFNGKTVDGAITAWAPAYISALVNSAYFDLLSEYSTDTLGGSQRLTRGTSTQPYFIQPTLATRAAVNDNDIIGELDAQMAAGALPAPETDDAGNANTLYVIFFPPGVTVGDSGKETCVYNCGYHGLGGKYAYAVIPDLTQTATSPLPDGGTVTEPCGAGCTYNGKARHPIEWFNVVVSHEIAEAVTDPFADAWYDSQNTDFACAGSKSMGQAGGGEIADLCPRYWDDDYGIGECDNTLTVPGTNIVAQRIWSNAMGGCYVANPATPPQCPPGGCVDGGAGPIDPEADASTDDAPAADATLATDASAPDGSANADANASGGAPSGGCSCTSGSSGSGSGAASRLGVLGALAAMAGITRRRSTRRRRD